MTPTHNVICSSQSLGYVCLAVCNKTRHTQTHTCHSTPTRQTHGGAGTYDDDDFTHNNTPTSRQKGKKNNQKSGCTHQIWNENKQHTHAQRKCTNTQPREIKLWLTDWRNTHKTHRERETPFHITPSYKHTHTQTNHRNCCVAVVAAAESIVQTDRHTNNKQWLPHQNTRHTKSNTDTHTYIYIYL